MVLCLSLFIPQILVQGPLLQILKQLGKEVLTDFILVLLLLSDFLLFLWSRYEDLNILSCILALLTMFLYKQEVSFFFFMKCIICFAVLLSCSTAKAMQSYP